MRPADRTGVSDPICGREMMPQGGGARIRYSATFIVRDRRAFGAIYNPSPTATRMTCDKYTTCLALNIADAANKLAKTNRFARELIE